MKVPLGHQLRIFLISDLHVDYKQNKEWMNRSSVAVKHVSSFFHTLCGLLCVMMLSMFLGNKMI